MEERTGADGFIVPELSKARLASARVILALAAVAAIVFGGCGGEDDDSADSTASTPSASQQASEEKGSRSGHSATGQTRGQGKDGQSTSGSQATSSQGKGKQGAKVQLPAGEPEPQATPAEEARATVTDISLSSPALASGSPPTLPSTYTCDGKDSWPALQWQGVPSDAKELILFAANVQPVEGKLFFDWAVAGLDPSLEGIEADRLPQGAIRGQNSFGTTGYSICPPAGQGETYVFALHAIPTKLSPGKGFDPKELRQQILAQTGNAGILVFTYNK